MSRHSTRLRAGLMIAAVGFAAALVGCGSESAPAEETTAAEASELSGPLTVYAAASLEPAFATLSGMFAEHHPDVEFEFSFDGSSVLATQILGGAPVDVYASADAPNMDKVTGDDLAEVTPIAFATSELAIAVAPENPLGITSLADLEDAPVVVVCAAEVPCGNASRTLLERDGVDLTPASEEQNVTAVLTKVREGEADAGLVYYSDILRAGGEVEGIEIENASEAAGDYLIVPIVGTQNPEAAQAFSEFLISDEAQELLLSMGFGPAR